MKKNLVAFLFTFIALPAMADNYIKFKASAIEDTINTMVPESHRVSAADEYQKQMDSTTGKISVMGIYKVCAAAGFNINNTNGYNGCRLFINTIAEKSGFGSNSANQQNCANKFNGIWALSPDGKQYQCVGKDGHKLVYHASCDGAGGDCIRDFSSLQTQEPNAREFIQAYGQQKNLQFTCWYTYDNRHGITSPLGQDYIKCSAGGESYEFEFDDLIQDPGKTAVESENTALCEMFGGKIVKHPDDSVEKQWQSCEVSQEICNGPLHNLAVKIGHNVMCQGYCRLSRTAKETSLADLKTLPGVDSRVFYNTGAQMRTGMAKEQTEEYLRTKFPNETYINCDPNPKILNEGFGIDRDYVMTCTVGSKQVDFIFHDLTEGADYKAESGEAKMACAIVAERLDGKNCRGLDQSACTDLGNKLKQMGRRGTDYKPEQGGCILLDTQNEELVNLGLEIAGGVALTVATGGYGAIVVVASIATDLGFEAINQWLRKIPYNDYQEFMEHANKCNDTDTSIENQYCVADVLNTYYALIMGNMSDLAPEYQAQASEKLEKMTKILSDSNVISTISPDKIPTLKQGRNYVSLAAMGILFIVNPDKLAAKCDDLIRQAVKMGTNLTRNVTNLRYAASKNFTKYLDDFKMGGQSVGLPIERLSTSEWQALNNSLIDDGVELFQDGQYMRFRKLVKVTDINDLLRKFNKTPVFRPAASNSLGRDYYRIIINDNDDVAGIIADLQKNGYFVSANQTITGEKFIGVSKENIFQQWADAPTNWLNGYSGGSIRGRGIFDKVYNDMPEDVLRRKLDYIYSVQRNGGTDHDIIEAMKAVGAFNERQAGLLAEDIANETIRRISENADLVQMGKNWRNLSEYEKKQFVIEVHDIVTRERRARVGDTVISFDNSDPDNWGWHRGPSAGMSREFSYNIENYLNASDALGTIIHENTHSFQSVYKSSIPDQFVRLSNQHYVQPDQNFNDYQNVLIEVEARYVADHSVPRVIRTLGWR